MIAAVQHRARATELSGGLAAPWLDAVLVLALALLWRSLFFNGAFGSDDAVYLERALDVAAGHWTASDYNGALRYGFNIPAGGLLRLFGTSLVVANLWPLLCSLAEIGLVVWFVRDLFGRWPALLAGLVLGAAPLHIAVATRIHADPVVSFFLTAAYVAVYAALRRRSLGLCLAAGLALGGVFWAKELVAVVYFAFVPLLWYFRRWWAGAAVALGGLLLMLALHGALMQWVAGDPLHAVKVVLGALGRNFVHGGVGEDSPWYYLRYLFVDIRHVGLLGFLALAGLLVCSRAKPESSAMTDVPGGRFLLLWLLGVMLVLSVFPASLSPLRFTMKQSNYISLFLAPLAIAAAVGLACLRARLGLALAVLVMALGLALGALQQADYRAFTANSKAIAQLLAQRDGALLVGNRSLVGIASIWTVLHGQRLNVISYHDAAVDAKAFGQRAAAAPDVLAAVDLQTAAWGANGKVVTQALPCWQLLANVQATDLGWGNHLAAGLSRAVAALPGAFGAKAADAFGRLGTPAAAQLFRVPAGTLWCDAR